MAGRKSCTTCNKGGIVMSCDRCEHTFCDKHVIEHRQQSTNQLNDLIREHDLLQDEIKHTSNSHFLFKAIDKWEKESMIKIQSTAEAARIELREMIETSKDRISSTCHDVVKNLQVSREAGQFCQDDLIRSMQQLKDIKMKIASPLPVNLVENKNSSIHLITIKGTDFMNKEFEKAKIISITKRVQTSHNQDKFSKVIGSATISEDGLLAKHNCQNSTFAYIIGQQLYSKGRQTIRFKIEHSQMPYNIFFGCISSQMNLNQINYNLSCVAGWFGYNEVYHHGSTSKDVQMHGYDSNKIETYDVLSLTFDCDEKQIELYPERTKKIHELSIDTDKAPLPWQLLVVLTYENDSVRILYNA
ncbi:unnamed protein product [Adineta steineri]|uniref:B box-type domain-containing protein n=1 Tax=Adineta steineri TaxID=433720 RepID=A0A814CDW5_9BILA|nr:unnamed protein product [Adineta steineri]